MTVKLCECGCGLPAPIAKITSRARGYAKGEPMRFRHGHHQRRAWKTADRAIRTDTGCLEWQGKIGRGGYGVFNRTQAHRVAWVEAFGPIPAGMIVMHTCDNPPCVEPSHLRLGTFAENSADMVAKGRSRRGTAVNTAVLTEDDVRAIRADNRPAVVIAREYGCTAPNISAIRRRLTWRHVE
jgi:hypothetical protein